MNPYTDATDKTKLTIVDSSGTTIPSSSYNITNVAGVVELNQRHSIICGMLKHESTDLCHGDVCMSSGLRDF